MHHFSLDQLQPLNEDTLDRARDYLKMHSEIQAGQGHLELHISSEGTESREFIALSDIPSHPIFSVLLADTARMHESIQRSLIHPSVWETLEAATQLLDSPEKKITVAWQNKVHKTLMGVVKDRPHLGSVVTFIKEKIISDTAYDSCVFDTEFMHELQQLEDFFAKAVDLSISLEDL